MRFFKSLYDTARLYGRWMEAEFKTAPKPCPGADKRHLLILTEVLPPYVSGGVYRPTSWLRFGGENNWRVSAVGAELSNKITPAGEYLKESIPDNATLAYAPDPKIQPAWRLSPRLQGGFLSALKLYRTAVARFGDDPPSVIVATGPSFFSYVAGMWAARYFGAKLVLDYRDEWTECPFDFVKTSSWDIWWEKRCLDRADKVFFTTEAMLKHQLEVFPNLSAPKCAVQPNGWDSTDVPDMVPQAHEKDGKDLQYLTFLGNLPDWLLPDDFLASFAQLLTKRPDYRSRIGLRFVGIQSPLARKALDAFPYPENIKTQGLVTKPEAERLARESFALLTLTSVDLARYRPGKVIEYLASDRPLLVYGAPGEVSALVSRLGAGVFVGRHDVTALEAAVARLFNDPPESWKNAERRAWTAANSRRALAKGFFASLDGLIEPDAFRQ